jgi:Thioesterase-like superfamily
VPEEPAAYEIDGDVIVPTDRARGVWSGEQQHGACLLGLLTRCLERVPTAVPMRFTRITADLSRPVPMRPFAVVTRTVRDGRRVQSLEASVIVDGVPVARAVATRIRVAPGLVHRERLPPVHSGDESPPFTEGRGYKMPSPSFLDCLEARILDARDAVHARTWFRLSSPLVRGEEPTPLVRLASIADMVMSSASRLGEGWISINPELSLQIERQPIGDWICMSSAVRFTDDGIGVSEGVLHDRSGRVGRSSKSVLNYRGDGSSTP